jgi:hypothetical protein
MARNPHFDRETITEDIGFRGPHFDFNERITDIDRRTPTQAWTPEGEYGIHGEGHGWESKKVLPDPDIPGSWRGGDDGWGNYPADEFTGIQSTVPSGGGFLKNIFEKFGRNIPRLGGGFDTPYHQWPWQWQQDQDLLQKRKYDKYLEFMNQDLNRFDPQRGPWNEFNPSNLPYLLYPDWDDEVIIEDLMENNQQSNLDNWDLIHLMSNGYTLEEAQAELERQLG